MARSKPAKNDNLVDPKLKKQFIEMRDHWQTLNDRANSAVGKRRQYEAEIKQAGFRVQMMKDALRLQTPEGEAEFKAEIANRLLAAAYADADIGDQLSLFLDHNRTPAVDRAYKEGQTSAMKNEAAVPKYDPDTDQYRAFMEGYHDEQGRQVQKGIKKLDPDGKGGIKGQKGGKGAKGAKAADKPKGKRGRPPGPAKAAKDDAPPRKPGPEPVTRATMAAAKSSAPAEDGDSYFSKTAGNA